MKIKVTTRDGLELTHDSDGYRQLVNAWHNTTGDMVATSNWVAMKANLTQESALRVVEAVMGCKAVLVL